MFDTLWISDLGGHIILSHQKISVTYIRVKGIRFLINTVLFPEYLRYSNMKIFLTLFAFIAVLVNLILLNSDVRADTYDPATNLLTISSVQVGSKNFTDVVVNLGNFQVLDFIDAPDSAINSTPSIDHYDATNHLLSIPLVTVVGGKTFKNVSLLLDDSIQVITADKSTTAVSEECSSTGSAYYVSPNGSDANSGFRTHPWKTIQKAMNNATPGSIVNIMTGKYTEKLQVNVQGIEGKGNCITFQPNNFAVPSTGCGGSTGILCKGEEVVLDYKSLGIDTTKIPFLLVNQKNYIRIQGLTFQNYSPLGGLGQGVRIDGASNYIEFKHNKFLNNKETGEWNGCCAFLHFRVWGPAKNIWIYGNEFGNLVTNYSEALTIDEGGQYAKIENNWFHDTDGIAIDLYRGANNYIVRNNKLEYIGIKRDGSIWYNSQAAAIYNDGGHTGVIERNVLDHVGNGITALSEPKSGGTAHDIIIRNNIVQHAQIGIVLGTWYSETCGDASVYNINVLNNTFYDNLYGVSIRPMKDSTVKWGNNIFANNKTSYGNSLKCPSGTAYNNMYFGGGSGPGEKTTSDPQFVNASMGNFDLKAISPAINVGDPSASVNNAGSTDVIGKRRFVGTIDIGAHEFQGNEK